MIQSTPLDLSSDNTRISIVTDNMPTGVETAGIVLAVFPICIGLINIYFHGAATLNKMRHHHRVLREFHRELDMESCKFYNSLLNLFDDTITEQDCARFFRDPKGAEEKLKARLVRPQTAKNFIDGISAMSQALSDLEHKFASLDKSIAEKMKTKAVQVDSDEYVKVWLKCERIKCLDILNPN